MKKKNMIADALYITGMIVLGLGVIGSFALGSQLAIGYGEFNFSIFLTGIISTIVFSLSLFGFGEIINILHDNRELLKKIAESRTENNDYEEDELPDL